MMKVKKIGVSQFFTRISVVLSSQLFRSLVILGVFLSCQKGIGFYKELYISNSFGLNFDLEALLIATTYLMFPISALMASYQTAFITRLAGFPSVDERDRFSNASVRSLFKLVCVVCVIWVIINYIFSSVFFKVPDVVMKCFLALIPYGIFSSVSLIYYGRLQFESRFTLNGLLPCLTPVILLLSLLLYSAIDETVETFVIAGGLCVGAFLEFIILKLLFYRRLPQSSSKVVHEQVMGSIKKCIPIILATLVTSLAPLVEQYFVSRVQIGGVLVLRIAGTLPLAIAGMLSTITGMVALPGFSDYLLKHGFLKSVICFFRFSLAYGALAVFAFGVIFVFSKHLLQFFYDESIFDIETWGLIEHCFQSYSLLAISSCLYLFVIRFLYAVGMVNLALVSNVIFVFMNVLLLVINAHGLVIREVPLLVIVSHWIAILTIIVVVYLKEVKKIR